MTEEDAVRLVRAVTGGRRYIQVDKYAFQRVKEAITTLTPIEETSSLHWWEEVYDVDGELYAAGGVHSEPDSFKKMTWFKIVMHYGDYTTDLVRF